VGSTTGGADGNVSPVPLPGGLRAAISGIGVFYPDKRPTQQVGIVPNVEVRPTIAGIRAGRDEVLEAAVGPRARPPVPPCAVGAAPEQDRDLRAVTGGRASNPRARCRSRSRAQKCQCVEMPCVSESRAPT
jgi:hypothetical protein